MQKVRCSLFLGALRGNGSKIDGRKLHLRSLQRFLFLKEVAKESFLDHLGPIKNLGSSKNNRTWGLFQRKTLTNCLLEVVSQAQK